MQLYVAPKISKIPSLVVASIPKLPQCHHTFWTFVRDPGTMITPWICWKTYSCTERSWQDKCEYPWIFRNTLNFNAVILFFHDSKKRGSLELWEGAGYAFLPTNLSSKNPMNFTARSTPSSRLLLGDNLPVKVAHINPAMFDRNVDAALEKGHIHLWKSAITS